MKKNLKANKWLWIASALLVIVVAGFLIIPKNGREFEVDGICYKVVDDISNIVAVFGKKTIDLLQEYASIVKTHKTILDDSQFKELKLIEATDQQIEEYVKLRNHNKAHRRLESILSELKDLGFTIDFHKNQCAINKHDKTV